MTARHLGLKVAPLTAVGRDKAGDFVLRFREREGVVTPSIPVRPGIRTSTELTGIEKDRFPLVEQRANRGDMASTIDDVLATPSQPASSTAESRAGRRQGARVASVCATIVVTRHGCANFIAHEDGTFGFVAAGGGP